MAGHGVQTTLAVLLQAETVVKPLPHGAEQGRQVESDTPLQRER